MVDSLTGGSEILCDVCNRNQFPCRCRLAKDDLVISCQYFIRALNPRRVRRPRPETGAVKSDAPTRLEPDDLF